MLRFMGSQRVGHDSQRVRPIRKESDTTELKLKLSLSQEVQLPSLRTSALLDGGFPGNKEQHTTTPVLAAPVLHGGDGLPEKASNLPKITEQVQTPDFCH